MQSTRGEFQHLFWRVYAPAGGAALVLVIASVVVLVLRYRGGERRAGASSNTRLELVVACLLGAIVVALLTRTYAAEGNDDSLHPASLVIAAVAFQWGWTFSYPGSGVSLSSAPNRAPTLVLPVGETIEVRLRSRDVIHSFWVPEQRFKRLAYPGRETRFDLRFDRTGRWSGLCSTFCGLRHEDMTFVVSVRSPGAFRAWLHGREARS